MNKLQEKVARAICAADAKHGGSPWEELDWFNRGGVEVYMDRADFATQVALRAAQQQIAKLVLDGKIDFATGRLVSGAIAALRNKATEADARAD